MAEPQIALVFSPDMWVEELHRFVTDHGGARVRSVVVDPAVAFDEPFTTLVVSWRWPALTRGLVDELHDRGRAVLGVHDREEPAAAELLGRVGVDAIIEADARMSDFVAVLEALERAPRSGATAALATAPAPRLEPTRWLTVGGPAGAGATEVAIELARVMQDAVLVDLDEVAPAVAPRLALPIEPNLRGAIDAVEFGVGDIGEALVAVEALGALVLSGLPNVAAWPQIRAPEVLRVLRALATRHRRLVIDTSSPLDDLAVVPRGRYAVTRAVVADAAAVVAVGAASPVGVVRLLGWIADAQVLRPGLALHVVLNRTPRDQWRRAQLEHEVRRTFVPESITVVPDDPRVEQAAWAGVPVASGPFRRAIAPLADMVDAALATRVEVAL